MKTIKKYLKRRRGILQYFWNEDDLNFSTPAPFQFCNTSPKECQFYLKKICVKTKLKTAYRHNTNGVWNLFKNVGTARTPFPATKNYTHELFTLGIIAGVNSIQKVQWSGLALEEPPSWSRITSTPGKYALTLPDHTIYTKRNINSMWIISIS